MRLQGLNTRANGQMNSPQEWESRSVTKGHTRVIIWMERNMEKAILNGIMDHNTKDNLDKVIHMVKVKSRIKHKTITTKDSSNMVSHMVKAYKSLISKLSKANS